MEIKNIIFDFGEVLLDWNPKYLYEQHFADQSEMNYFLENVCNHDWNREQDRGRPFAEAVKVLQEQFPAYAEKIALYDECWGTMLRAEIPGTVEILRALSKTHRIFGLTNWSAEKINIAYDNYEFFKYFEGIIVSGEEKLIKPDQEIYKLLLGRFGIKAEESLFIDDNPANVAAAKELGIHAIHFVSAPALKEELKHYHVML
ncbi:HAD family hydrolase [Pedobacter sp. PACM 27299]|uniref:HAD family hydrolase n=1 Tax=Pedobacter sp. PACM 27299 TaxID=1727164 RepID=UPI0007061E65|nr:HAD family phosphatase [Pedobacter sp. PACM 27299]ALL07557.1 HAD family hydrolase [Pedobacter sp. PACM 27299]